MILGFRAPRVDDDNRELIAGQLAVKLPEWEANDIVPSELFPEDTNDDRPIQYGKPLWRDMFSSRQLLCHGVGAEIYRELFEAEQATGAITEIRKAAYVYLALTLDKMLNYNSRMSVWMVTREVVANTFNRHDFAFCASHCEIPPLIAGLGYDWAVDQTEKCIEELVALVRPEEVAAAKLAAKAHKRNEKGSELFASPLSETSELTYTPPQVTITCKSGDHLDHIAEKSIDVVVMDPPY